jgi:glc operon protein GlcG
VERGARALAIVWLPIVLATTLSSSADRAARDGSLQEAAERIVRGCFEYALSKHFPPLSIAVVDEGGALVFFKRQDDAVPLTGDAALLKAQTAVRVRRATSDLAGSIQDQSVKDIYILLNATTLPGGIPIFRNDGSLSGAVGVSGADAGQDAACAQEALAGVFDRRRAPAEHRNDQR